MNENQHTTNQPSIVFIGGGNMAQAILGGLNAKGHAMNNIHVIDPNPNISTKLQALGVACSTNWPNHLKPTMVVLAVKPQHMSEVLAIYAKALHQPLLVSIAAGVSISSICQATHNPRVVRAMPNTPALVGAGMTGLFASPDCEPEVKQQVNPLFAACGQSLWLETEDDINAITAVSGSGPGFVFYCMEHWIQGAQQLGLSPETAQQLVLQTVLGAATLAIHTQQPPAQLRAQVTSKGGTTEAGLNHLQTHAVGDALSKAMLTAYERAKSLNGD